MEKALKIGKTSATGGFQLFVGKTLSTVILAVGTIIVGLFIGEGEYGLYSIALIPATTMLLFQDWGVGSAMTKYCAQYRAANKQADLRKIIAVGLTFEIATALFLTALSVLMANFIATTVFSKPESAFLITVASIIIFSTALLSSSQSIFIGFERMDLSTYTMICQAVVNCMLSPLLVYLGYGGLGATLGYAFSILMAGIIAMILLYLLILKKLPSNTKKSDMAQTLKPLLQYGIPLAIALIFAGILSQFYAFLMAAFCDAAMIGNYRIATNFGVLLTFFTFPIATVLFPAFSKLNPKNEQHLLKTVFTSSVKYTALFLVPATMALMLLSKPIIGTLYGDKWLYAPTFLTLAVISNLFAIFGNLSMNSLLTALGETKMLMKLNIIAITIGVPLAFVLIPQFEIIGVILVGIVAAVPGMIVGLYWVWKRYGTRADFQVSTKIFLSSAIAAVVTYLFLSVFNAADWLRLVTGSTLFLVTYLTVASLIGAINQKDIDNLRAMFSGLGIISKILEILLTIIQKMLRARNILKNQPQPQKNL